MKTQPSQANRRSERFLKRSAILLISGFVLAYTSSVQGETSLSTDLFIEPQGLQDNIDFWTRIYSAVDSDAGLVHDLKDLGRVYEEVIFPERATARERERLSESRKSHYKKLLIKLARNKAKGASSEEKRILALFPSDVSSADLHRAAQNLRFQTGQSDRFRAGLIRSGAYASHVRETLEQMQLPPELAVIPHVESSYTPHAYSRIGAAGLWQFTRSTGRRFMRVDHVVDERLDPYISTTAAARLLEQNYRVTGSWPLAITAYNHGASGMRRAARKLGTQDIAVITHQYKSRTFGFASRNFYSEFLAALRIAKDPEAYFGPLEKEQSIELDYYELPFYTTPKALAEGLQVEIATIRTHNPALLEPVWAGQKRIPRGFKFKLPKSELSQPLKGFVTSLPSKSRFAYQTPDTYHRVQRGETLSHIAARYGVQIRELQSINNLRSRHHVRAGQKLRLPTDADRSELITLAADGRYTIQSGDTLEKIARRFGASENQIMAANSISNRHRIQAGQVLRIPSRPETQSVASSSKKKPKSSQKSNTETPKENPAAQNIPPPSVQVGVMALDESKDVNSDRTLLADPSDYSVSKDGTIEVQTGETLGHYADWLDLRASRLRALNGMSYGAPLTVHRHLRMDFSSVSRADFERKRLEFHEDIQEAFFAEWEITGTETHRLRKGDSLWVLSHRKFRVPLWLIQQYNPDLDLSSPSAGSSVSVPVVRRKNLDRNA